MCVIGCRLIPKIYKCTIPQPATDPKKWFWKLNKHNIPQPATTDQQNVFSNQIT
jgi:hypothetical protein